MVYVEQIYVLFPEKISKKYQLIRVHVHADLAGIGRVQSVFHIHKAADAAFALGFGDHVQTDRGLARTLRPVDLQNAAFGHPTHAQSNVQTQAARGDGLHVEPML